MNFTDKGARAGEAAKAFEQIATLEQEIGKVIVGQQLLVRRLLTGLFASIPYSFTGGDLVTALQQIEQGERRLVGWRTTTEYRDLYPYALGAAALAIAALWILL